MAARLPKPEEQTDDLGRPPMVLRLRPAIHMTDDQFLKFCALNGDLRIERTAEGDLEIMAPAGSGSGRRNFQLAGMFYNWQEQDGTGLCFDSSAGFKLPNGAERAPDVSWIRWERWEALTKAQKEKFAPLCPDFVLELRSPNDRLSVLKKKVEEYIANGARLGWLLDPIHKQVYVYRPGVPAECLNDPETVSGDPVLNGFVLDVRKVWHALERQKK